MSTPEEQIPEIIKEAGGLEADSVRLAQVVSMAARVDWPLLRRARLELLPDVDPSAEADLWASSLVHSRGPDGFVLRADVAAWLQNRLAREDDAQTRLGEAGELMLHEHEHLPPSFRLEERLIYWGLSKKYGEATLKRELGQVVRALQDPNRRSLTVWVERALDRLPDRVRQLEPALVLRDAVVLWSDVGGQTVSDVSAGVGRDIWAALITTKSEKRHSFLLRLVGGVLGIAPNKRDATPPTSSPPAVEIEAPDTDPLFIEVRWREGDEHRIARVFPRADEAIRLRVGTELEIHFADGMGLAVQSDDATVAWVNTQIVRLLEDLPDSVVEKAAKQLGIEHVLSTPRRPLLSGTLIRRIPKEGLSALNMMLEVLKDSFKPQDAIRFFDILTPLWVDPSAAQHLREVVMRPLDRRGVFLNCTDRFTAELYIRRAWLGMEPPVVVTMDSTEGSSHLRRAIQEVANALSRQLNVEPSELSQVLARYDRPVLLLLHLDGLSDDTIRGIANEYPKMTLFLYGQSEPLAPKRFPAGFVSCIEPALAPEAERTFITEYEYGSAPSRRKTIQQAEETWGGIQSRRVFISCTTNDLAEYRREAMTVMNALNEEYKGEFQLADMTMDDQGRSGERETPVDVSKAWVQKADWIVLIVAWNYGYVQEGHERSVTEWEYRYSQEQCDPPKTCFVFLAGETIEGDKRYERKKPGLERNLAHWARPPDEQEDVWLKNRVRLQNFKNDLRTRHYELFSDIEDFSKVLRNTLNTKIKSDLKPDRIAEMAKDRDLLMVILAQMKSIQDFIAEIKPLATLKRIHDRLHCIRQFGICRWRGEVLNLWEQGAIDGEGKETFLEVQGEVKQYCGALENLKIGLPPDRPPLRLGKRIQTVLEFTWPTRQKIGTMAKKEFESNVNDFARSVQKAFEEVDRAMFGRLVTLRKQHDALIKGLVDARKRQALSARQDQMFDEGLQRMTKRLDETEEVLTRHSRWQAIHNELEDLDLAVEDHFPRELDAFLKSNRAEISTMLDEVVTVLGGVNTDLMSNIKAIKALVCVEPDQLGDRGAVATAYASMRKAYDDLFFDLDRATLAFVNQSDTPAKTYEEKLRDLEKQVRSRTIPMR